MTTPDITDLLRRCRAVIEGGGWTELERDIAKALASLNKPAPAEQTRGERKAFESWVNRAAVSTNLSRDGFGFYVDDTLDVMWEAWAARAELANQNRAALDKPAPDAAALVEAVREYLEWSDKVICKDADLRKIREAMRAALDKPATAEDCSGVHPAPDAAALVEAVRNWLVATTVTESLTPEAFGVQRDRMYTASRQLRAALQSYDQQTGCAS